KSPPTEMPERKLRRLRFIVPPAVQTIDLPGFAFCQAPSEFGRSRRVQKSAADRAALIFNSAADPTSPSSLRVEPPRRVLYGLRSRRLHKTPCSEDLPQNSATLDFQSEWRGRSARQYLAPLLLPVEFVWAAALCPGASLR